MKFPLVFVLLLASGCSSIETGNDVLDAVYAGTAAIIKHDEAAASCKQGHEQDRINCRKKKQAQVEALNEAIKKETGR